MNQMSIVICSFFICIYDIMCLVIIMNKKTIFAYQNYDEHQLIEYGFIKQEGKYVFRKALADAEFYAEFVLTPDQLDVNVYESANDELYVPFNVQRSKGSFVTMIREETDEILEDIKTHCFQEINIREEIFAYVNAHYGTVPAYPWDQNADYATLTHESGKWYGLIMNIPARLLDLGGEETIDVMNIKLPPETIQSLIDHKHYFPAYHMNKKYWLTLLLDARINLKEVYDLLDQSYLLTE